MSRPQLLTLAPSQKHPPGASQTSTSSQTTPPLTGAPPPPGAAQISGAVHIRVWRGSPCLLRPRPGPGAVSETVPHRRRPPGPHAGFFSLEEVNRHRSGAGEEAAPGGGRYRAGRPAEELQSAPGVAARRVSACGEAPAGSCDTLESTTR